MRLLTLTRRRRVGAAMHISKHEILEKIAEGRPARLILDRDAPGGQASHAPIRDGTAG